MISKSFLFRFRMRVEKMNILTQPIKIMSEPSRIGTTNYHSKMQSRVESHISQWKIPQPHYLDSSYIVPKIQNHYIRTISNLSLIYVSTIKTIKKFYQPQVILQKSKLKCISTVDETALSHNLNKRYMLSFEFLMNTNRQTKSIATYLPFF